MRTLKQFVLRLTLGLLLFVAPAFGATGAPFVAQQVQGLSSPQELANLSAWYDTSDLSTLRNNAGAIPSSGDGIKLIADKSGNSAVNVLALNGVAGNYASAPDSVPLSIVGDITIDWFGSLPDYTPAASMVFAAKRNTNISYQFFLNPSGIISLLWSADGAATLTANSTTQPVVSDFGTIGLRATLDVDNGAAGYTVRFFTSPDFVTWTQLGSDVTVAGVTSIFNSADGLEIGSRTGGTALLLSGNTQRLRIYPSYQGTGAAAFDANFATAAKLATSFTESSSNAATVTINTSGDLGARICAARDLYQFTSTKQPILTIAATGNYLTFDGSNDYMKAAAFSLSQPESVYIVGSQVTWTSADRIYDGNSDDSGRVTQVTSSPNINLYAGSSLSNNGNWAVGTNAIVTAIINGASSALRVNRGTAITGDAGASAMNGFTLAKIGVTAGNYANITFSEGLIYAAAHSSAQQDSVIGYEARHWSISGGFAFTPAQPSLPIPQLCEILPLHATVWEDELAA